jgi:Na+-driven multidrug efflux pump
MVISASVNLILDPIFIFGIGSFSGWGLKGAATATVFARAISMIFSVWILKFREKMITFEIPSFKIGIESWKKILYIGLPAAGTNMIIPFSMGIITRFVAAFGVEAVAALGVATRIESFSLTVIMALGSVIIPFVGQNFGAKDMSRIEEGVGLSQKFAFLWGLMLTVFFLVFGGVIAGLFNSNTIVIKNIRLYLVFVSSSYSFLGILMINGSTFNAVGKPIPSAMLSALRMIILYIPLSYFLARIFNLRGIFIAASTSNFITGSLAYFWLKSELKKMF